VQGCTLGCPGCYNPGTHSRKGGYSVLPEFLARQFLRLSGKIEGVTISGGEPLQQMKPLLSLLFLLRNWSNFSLIVFTGYTWSEIGWMGQSRRLLSLVDVVIAGRYERRQRLARSLQGSANKTFHFLTRRYQPADFQKIPEAEIIITSEGEVVSTGIDPVFIRD